MTKSAVNTQVVKFESGETLLGGHLYVPEGDIVAAAVCVTGGQSNAQDVFGDWQTHMANNGIASLAFDARGVGVSDGMWSTDYKDAFAEQGIPIPRATELNSQFRRVQDTRVAIEKLGDFVSDDVNMGLIGTGMGGDVAIKAAKGSYDKSARPIRAVVLKSPAAYHPTAHTAYYGRSLRSVLSDSRRYPPRLAANFAELRELKRPTQLIRVPTDEIIPPEIDALYKDAVISVGGDVVTVGTSDTRHGFFGDSDDVSREAKDVAIKISTDFLLRHLENR